jgi:hypothetical protein
VAEKPSAWKNRFSFEHDGYRYELEKESVWKSDLVLSREDLGTVGYVRRKSVYFKREWEAEIPDELPPEVGAFVVWLAVLLARRADSAAASSGATGGS